MAPALVESDARYVEDDVMSLFGMQQWNLDGTAWSDAEPPSALHRHWPQSVIAKPATATREVWYCPCGAAARPGRSWTQLRDQPRVTGRFAFLAWLTTKKGELCTVVALASFLVTVLTLALVDGNMREYDTWTLLAAAAAGAALSTGAILMWRSRTKARVPAQDR